MLEDPLSIDRRLRETARSFASFRSALREGRGEDHAFEHTGRWISLELLSELADAPRDPLAPALLRFAHRLHEAHALIELERAHATAVRAARHALDEPERGRFTLSELLANALADTKGLRAAYLTALAANAGRATELALRLADGRAEVRSERAKVVALDVDLPGLAVLEAASTLGLRTLDAFRALAPATLAELLELGLGRDSRASWPGRLTARGLAELFADAPWLAHVTPEPFALPPALGASSYLRALFGFGAALRAAFPSSSQPFVLGRDAYGLERATFGALFALLPMNDSFARRRLGITPQAARDHRRSLARVVLVALRESALKVALRAPSFAGASALGRAYAELGHEWLGVELRPSLLGVVFTPRPGDAQRFAALLLAAALAERLVETHDEDWYRNPRAVEELRESARAPARTSAEASELEAGTSALVKWLADAL